MRLALFDLDNTLLAGDSDHSWGEWLCQRGLVDAAEYQARNDAFYADYVAGKLDVLAYQAFTQAILGRTEMAQLETWHRQFMQEVIEPIVLAKGEALLAEHRAAGDRLVIITATNRFVTGPIAERLGVETLIATECEMRDGRYTGQTFDVPCFQGGKVVRLQRWLDENGLDLEGASFYSDSLNDLPLLERSAGRWPSTPIRAYAPRRKNAAGRSFPCVDPLTSAPSDGRRHGGGCPTQPRSRLAAAGRDRRPGHRAMPGRRLDALYRLADLLARGRPGGALAGRRAAVDQPPDPPALQSADRPPVQAPGTEDRPAPGGRHRRAEHRRLRPGQRFPGLGAAARTVGIGWSFFRIGGLSAVVYCAADHQRGRAMGLYNGLYRLGSLVGMLLGGLLVPVLGLPALALSFAFLALLGLPLLARGFDLPENPAGHARTSAATAATSVARRPPPRGLVILSGFATALLIQGVLAATLSALIARSFGTEVSLLGLALSAAGLSGIIQALRWSWEPWLAGRFGAWSDGPRGRRRFYVAALLVGAMGFGLLSSRLPILAWLAIALLVMLVATALTTLTDALAADVARAGDVVGFMTRYSIVQDLGAALGPALAFLLLERPGGFAWLYWGGSWRSWSWRCSGCAERTLRPAC